MATPSAQAAPEGIRARDLLAMAAWFGLVTGLLEGIVRTALQSLGGISWEMRLTAASVKVIWVAPLFYVLFFVLGAAGLAVLGRLAPRLPMASVAVFLFGLVGFSDLLSASGRVSQLGVAMLALGLAVMLTRWCNAHERAALNFWKRSVIWVAAFAVLACAGIETGLWMQERNAIAALRPAAPGSPNVLVILVDTLRADHLTLYGYARKTSPKLDKIAEQSVVFENAMTTAPWTLPSHASLLTGLFPTEHGAEKFSLGKGHPMLPEALQASGYRTAAFSANTLFFTRAQGFGRGFIRFEDSFHNLVDMMARTLLGQKLRKYVLRKVNNEDLAGRRTAADINDSALAWIEEKPETPFFVFLNYFDTHPPLVPPPPYRTAFTTNENAGEAFNEQLDSFGTKPAPPDVVADGIAAYDGAVRYVDEEISRLLERLDQNGLGRNTIVIVTADHGEMFGEHNDFGRAHSMWEPVLRVPLIVRWPEKIGAGRRVETPVSLASLPATVMELTGAGDSSAFPGPSLAPLWEQEVPPTDWPYPWAELAACPERNRPYIPCYSGALKAIQSPDWYFIYHEKQAPQLYDAKKDRAQLQNLADTPEGQKVVADFLLRVREKRMRMGASQENALAAKKAN
ncbi:MAG: sulfatase [Acidobacteria bacterium]|nr:sulfatase [Acidobacteriota bacterium]MCL5288128.1 sulfatase [Acidobacteriota bacterium]